MSNSAVELLRAQFKGAHDVLEGTMEGVTADQAHWTPPGVANPLSATYGHVLTSEDGMFNAVIQGGQPLMASTWAGKVGLSEMPPMGSSWDAWGRTVQVDLAALREYGQAVFAATDAYLGTLADSDLGREIDLSAMGLGKFTLGQLSSLMISNINWHTGEIACLKGLQGLKGYPF